MNKMSNIPHHTTAPGRDYYEDDTIDLYELWMTIWNKKKFIIIFCSAVVVLTIIMSLIMTPIFKAETTVIPVSSKSNMLGGMSDLAALAGFSMGGADNDIQKIMAVLNSRSVKETVIKKLDLIKVIFEDGVPKDRNPMLAAIEIFERQVDIVGDKKTGLISIAILNKDPELAKKICDTYVAELIEILNSKSLSVSQVKREFLERQLKTAELRLKKGQRGMAGFQKRTKMLQPVEQAKGTMELYAELIAKKTAFEVQLKSMESALSYDSPILKNLRNQISAIDKKLASIEGNTNMGALPSIGGAPDKMVQYADYYRELEISKAIYETLLKLYEQAKLEEAQESLFVQVIDPAVVPDRKFKPKRTLMVIVAGFTSGFFAIFLVFFMKWLKELREGHGRA